MVDSWKLKITRSKKQQIELDKSKVVLQELYSRINDQSPVRNFKEALSHPGDFLVIAEIKKKSPSGGLLREDFQPVEIGVAYEDSGAAALSVLTEPAFFSGSVHDLSRVRDAVSLPCLRKDFILSEYQIWESRAFGADAILLIVKWLDDIQLRDYSALADELGMNILWEVHDREDARRLPGKNTALVGVNNRDLDTLNTSLQVSLDLAPGLVAQDRVLVSESGLKSGADLSFLSRYGYTSFLVGESFLKTPQPGLTLKQWLQEARSSGSKL